MAEEHARLFLPDVLEVGLVIEAQAVLFRTNGDFRDDRDSVPPIAMTMNRSLAPRRPGLGGIWGQQESGFAGENEVGHMRQPDSQAIDLLREGRVDTTEQAGQGGPLDC